MIKNTEVKLKEAMIKSENNNKSRCKSTEPSWDSIYVLERTKLQKADMYKKAAQNLSNLVLILKVKSWFRRLARHKDTQKALLIKQHNQRVNLSREEVQKTPVKDVPNERYKKGQKSSLDDHKTFESLEKELRNSCNQSRGHSKAKNWNKWGKLKRNKQNQQQSTPRVQEQANLVKVSNFEPSKSSKSKRYKGRARSPESISVQCFKQTDPWERSPHKNSEKYKENAKLVWLSLLYKYQVLLRQGFNSFKDCVIVERSYKGVALSSLCTKLSLKCMRDAFHIWKHNQRATLLQKCVMLTQLNTMIENKHKAIAFTKWTL